MYYVLVWEFLFHLFRYVTLFQGISLTFKKILNSETYYSAIKLQIKSHNVVYYREIYCQPAVGAHSLKTFLQIVKLGLSLVNERWAKIENLFAGLPLYSVYGVLLHNVLPPESFLPTILNFGVFFVGKKEKC